MTKLNELQYKYIPKEELQDGRYYYVHKEGQEYRGNVRKRVEIREWSMGSWTCNGLGSAGNWLALEEVPELDVDKYEIEEK